MINNNNAAHILFEWASNIVMIFETVELIFHLMESVAKISGSEKKLWKFV